MNIRNARHAAGGMIDCDYEHPKFGWIPFTANPGDVEQIGRDIHALALLGVVEAELPPTQEEIDFEAAQAKAIAAATAAKADAKLTALGNMTPAQVRAWVGVNVTNLADAKDVLATLAVAVSILSRRL